MFSLIQVFPENQSHIGGVPLKKFKMQPNQLFHRLNAAHILCQQSHLLLPKPAIHMNQYGAVQLLLSAKIFVNHSLVDVCPFRNPIHPGSIKPFFCKFQFCRMEDVFSGPDRIPDSRCCQSNPSHK